MWDNDDGIEDGTGGGNTGGGSNTGGGGTPPPTGVYYVRVSGEDSSDGRSSRTAFRTIGRAAEVATNGDVVHVGGGSYGGEVLIEGIHESTAALRFVADQLGNSTGDAGAVRIVDSRLRVLNSNHVQFSGFTFSGSAARFVVWTGSYEGLLENCVFTSGDEGLLIENGSLTVDGCTLTDFAHDGIEVDGEALVTVRGTTISGCGESGIEVKKDANVTVENSVVEGNGQNGIKVAVTSGTPDPEPNCECTVVSPLATKQNAHQMLQTVSPADPVYQQLVTAAGGLLGETVQSSNWRDERHLADDQAASVFGKTQDAIEILDAVLREDVEFLIEDGTIVVDHPFFADVDIVGAAIRSGSSDLPVTVSVAVGDSLAEPWGDFDSATGGNVNDNNNPRSFAGDVLFDASETIRVAARSWRKVSNSYSGNYDSHWRELMTVFSDGGTPNTNVLRDGDPVPQHNGYNGQASAEAFLAPYIDSNDRIVLEDNQAIFLFELGTTNMNSSAADFQDLVVVVTMRRPGSTSLTDAERATLRTVLGLLLDSDQALAECAMNEATCLGVGPTVLAPATVHLNNGLGHRSSDAWQQAAEEFQDSWVAASATASLSNTTVATSSPTRPSSWSSISRGTLAVRDTTIQTNGFGLRFENDQDYVVSDNVIGGNGWGVYLATSASLDDCRVEDNTTGGIWLHGFTDSDLVMTDMTITDNAEYGLFIESSTLNLDAADMAGLSISGSRYLVAGSDCNLTFDGVTLSGGSTAALYATGGTLTVSGSTISDSGYGVAGNLASVHVQNSTLSNNSVGLYTTYGDVFVENSTLTGNTTWAASVAPSNLANEEVRFSGVTVHSNAGGIAVNGAEDGHFGLLNTVIRDNTNTGLHFENSTLTLNSQAADGWQSIRNLHGISADRSTLSLSNLTLTDSSSFALHTIGSDVTLQGSTFTGESGIYSSNNSSLAISSSRLTATAGGTKGIHREGGNVTVTNTVLNGFQTGLYLAAGSVSGTVTVRNTTVLVNGGSGLHLISGSADLSNTILAGTGSHGINVAGGSLTHSHNLLHGFSNPFTGTTAGTGEIVKDPRFVNSGAGNLQLDVGSPAINAGKDMTGVVGVDLLGAARPTHHAFEIGAYEFTQDQGSFRVLQWSEQRD